MSRSDEGYSKKTELMTMKLKKPSEQVDVRHSTDKVFPGVSQNLGGNRDRKVEIQNVKCAVCKASTENAQA